MANTVNLSKAAQELLISIGTNRQGAKLNAPTAPVAVRLELRDAGLIGKDSGLTRKGSIARERLVSAALDEAF